MTLTIDGVDHTADILAGSGPVITRTENGGDSLTVSILNGTGTANMLSPEYTVDGTAHTPLGLHNLVEYTDEHGVMFGGFVSEIVPKGEAIDIMAVDAVRVLYHRGTTLYHNYYGGVTRKSCRGGYDNGLYLEVPNNANVQEADWARNRAVDITSGSYPAKTSQSKLEATLHNVGPELMSSITFKVNAWSVLQSVMGAYHFRVYADGARIGEAQGEFKDVGDHEVRIDINPPVRIEGKTLSVWTQGGVHHYLTPRAGETVKTNDGDYADTTVWAKIEGMSYVSVQGQTVGTQYRLTASSAPGYPDVNDPSEAVPDFPERGRIYYSTPDGMSNTAIMSELIYAGGNYYRDIAGPTAPVTEFRASGGYIGDYLQTLADLPDGDGNQAVFYSDPVRATTVVVRKRPKITDPPIAVIRPATPDQPPTTDTGVPILYPLAGSFELRKSRRGKPSFALVKGTKTNTGETGDGTPIMFAVEDPTGGWWWDDTDTVKVSSSSNDYVSVAREAYGEVMRNRSKDWEGTVTVSGLHPELMSSGGQTVLVSDERYAIREESMRVREIVLDCSNMTTLVTLNNYGPRMNNPIRDSETMGLKTANLSVDNLSLDNYTLQYVRVRSHWQTPPMETGNTLSIRIRRSESETVISTVPVDAVIKFPEIGQTIVHATFPAGGVYENVYPHAVVGVRLNNGQWTDIEGPFRPDKKASQTLIVNLVIYDTV